MRCKSYSGQYTGVDNNCYVLHPCEKVEEPLFFVDFLREPEVDEETGETINAHPSFYESVHGGLPDIRKRVEGLQRKFNEESKVGGCLFNLFASSQTTHMAAWNVGILVSGS